MRCPPSCFGLPPTLFRFLATLFGLPMSRFSFLATPFDPALRFFMLAPSLLDLTLNDLLAEWHV